MIHHNAYRNTSIQTAPPDKLLLMLFDKLVTSVSSAITSIDQRNFADANRHIQKSQDILQELMRTVDQSIEIGQGLHALYDYCRRRLVTANMEKDTVILREVFEHLDGLRDAFRQASEKVRRHAE